MSKLKVLFSWSGEYLDQQFIATGDRNRGTGEIEFDLAEATVEQRRRIAAL